MKLPPFCDGNGREAAPQPSKTSIKPYNEFSEPAMETLSPVMLYVIAGFRDKKNRSLRNSWQAR
jgi:hypothetical protein